MDPKKKSFRKMPFYAEPIDKIKASFVQFQNLKDNLKEIVPNQFRAFRLSPKHKFMILLVLGGVLTVKTLRSQIIFKLQFLNIIL